MTIDGVSQAATVAAVETKPWDAFGISRATWYRHGKPDPAANPRREMLFLTQEEQMKMAGFSASKRSWQRYLRARRLAPEVESLMRAGLTGTAKFAEVLALMPVDFRKDIAEIIFKEQKPMELFRLWLFYSYYIDGQLPLAVYRKA